MGEPVNVSTAGGGLSLSGEKDYPHLYYRMGNPPHTPNAHEEGGDRLFFEKRHRCCNIYSKDWAGVGGDDCDGDGHGAVVAAGRCGVGWGVRRCAAG